MLLLARLRLYKISCVCWQVSMLQYVTTLVPWHCCASRLMHKGFIMHSYQPSRCIRCCPASPLLLRSFRPHRINPLALIHPARVHATGTVLYTRFIRYTVIIFIHITSPGTYPPLPLLQAVLPQSPCAPPSSVNIWHARWRRHAGVPSRLPAW